MKDKELIHISILTDKKTKLKEKANKKGKTLTAYINDLIDKELKKNE